MANEFDVEDPRFTALYIGVVARRNDPLRLGRVRVRIPGLIEPESNWAPPLGTVGGGSKQRGFFSVPEIGAEVGVLFNQGEPDHPYYLSGHWGLPNNQTEVPEPAGSETDPEEAPNIRTFETKRWELSFDDREGSELVRMRDKVSDDVIEIDGASYGIQIKATSAIVIKSEGLVSIEGLQIQLNGRLVAPVAKPIG